MPHEIEVKLEVRDPSAARRRLRELGFRRAGARCFESNRLYDFADGRLRGAGWVLRLRLVDDGRRCFLTMKCGAVSSRLYKIRREIETEVKDGARVAQILQMLGLRESLRYERHRTVYKTPAPADSGRERQLTYDETPLGDFIEIEGPKQWIDAVARQLGYRRADYITLGYPTLYSRWSGGKGRSLSLLSRGSRARRA